MKTNDHVQIEIDKEKLESIALILCQAFLSRESTSNNIKRDIENE